MGLANVTTDHAYKYVQSNWVSGVQTNFFKKHVLSRGAHLILVPCSLIANVADTILGSVVGIAAIGTLGRHRSTLETAIKHLKGWDMLVSGPYLNILKAINPEARIEGYTENDALNHKTHPNIYPKPPLITVTRNGFIADRVRFLGLEKKSKEYFNSDNFLRRHVASRLTIGLLAVACLVTRAVDAIIGIPAAALSILTLGKIVSLNNLAARTLLAPAIIRDLYFCTIGMIKPDFV